MNTTNYDWDWTRLREPSPRELARMDGQADFILCLYRRMMYPEQLEHLIKASRNEYGILRQVDIKQYPMGMSRRIDDGGCPEPDTLRAIHKTAATTRDGEWYIATCYKAVESPLKGLKQKRRCGRSTSTRLRFSAS